MSQHTNLISGLAAFQNWMATLRRDGMATSERNMVIDIDDDIARRFCIGIAEDRLFFGVQELEAEWFGALPWAHLAIRSASKNISFVTEEISLSGYDIPAFAIAMRADSQERARILSRVREIDIREVRLDETSGFISRVSRVALTTVPVIVVEDNREIDALISAGQPARRRTTVRIAGA